MRMLNLFKLNNKIKKSHVLLIGSFFVFIGAISLSWNYLVRIRNEVFEDMIIGLEFHSYDIDYERETIFNTYQAHLHKNHHKHVFTIVFSLKEDSHHAEIIVFITQILDIIVYSIM